MKKEDYDKARPLFERLAVTKEKKRRIVEVMGNHSVSIDGLDKKEKEYSKKIKDLEKEIDKI